MEIKRFFNSAHFCMKNYMKKKFFRKNFNCHILQILYSGLIFLPSSVCVCVYIYSKLATIVEGDPKAPFSIATTPRCRGGRYSIPRIAPLYP